MKLKLIIVFKMDSCEWFWLIFVYNYYLMQEESGEENNQGSSNKFKNSWYSTRWVFLEKIWSKTNQGITIPKVINWLEPLINSRINIKSNNKVLNACALVDTFQGILQVQYNERVPGKETCGESNRWSSHVDCNLRGRALPYSRCNGG